MAIYLYSYGSANNRLQYGVYSTSIVSIRRKQYLSTQYAVLSTVRVKYWRTCSKVTRVLSTAVGLQYEYEYSRAATTGMSTSTTRRTESRPTGGTRMYVPNKLLDSY